MKSNSKSEISYSTKSQTVPTHRRRGKDLVGNKAQVTIFIIIAIVIVAAVIGFFLVRNMADTGGIPASIEPVYNTFLFCLEDDALVGIDVLESQGGYINLPDFEPGSAYMPFSSQLDFLGNPIPYWYYVSGNNIPKEQVPSESDMEKELEDFIEKKITDCVFDSYRDQGFEIGIGEPQAEVNIKDNEVDVSLDMDLDINHGEDSAVIREHHILVKSKLSSLYFSAKKIYDYEQNSLFLEEYAVDTLRLYAPVDGVEITCSPKTWNAEEVFGELQNAIEANTLSLKVKGGDYSLKEKENKYFVIDLPVDSGLDVRFLNSKQWANGFEVNPSEGAVMIAKPIGNQPGLGVMGFCYVPYHFVYNVRYPVLVQVSWGDEIFQFPFAVVLQGNKPRKALEGIAFESLEPELCKYKNSEVEVRTYDTKLNSVDADISYECFSEFCEIGKTTNGILRENFPQCVNGYILARAEGYKDAKYLYSTNTDGGSVDVILNNLYELWIELKLDGKNYNNDAIISFISEDIGSKTIVYPGQKSINLSEGQYEVQVYIYRNSSIKLAETVQEQCTKIPKSGLGGILGMTDEKCFDIIIPEQIIGNALAGGGNENYYILESELIDSNTIEINVGSLPVPKTIEQLQSNYILFEDKGLDIIFK